MSLTRITSPIRSREFSVYDMEWYPVDRRDGSKAAKSYELRLIGVFDGKRYRSYTTVEAFLDCELVDKHHRRWFYAHAGGSSDLLFLLEKICQRPTWKANASFSGSAAVIARLYNGRKNFVFADSFFLLRTSLANIAKWIGRQKGGTEYKCPDCVAPNQHGGVDGLACIFFAPMHILRQYNELDCVILWEAIFQFQIALNELGGELQMTLASSAMSLFRRRYLTREIVTSEFVNECAKPSYTSSRVEPFAKHCERANYYDFNSSFPYAMTKPAPGNLIGTRSRLPDYDSSGNRPLCIAKARVKVPEGMYLPPLPYRHDKESRVYFPTGEWESWFTGVDLELLETTGGSIQRVDEVMVFEPNTDLAEYATDLYARRQMSESGSLENITIKLLLNALYGKFGEGSEKEALLLNAESCECPHKPAHKYGECIAMLFPGAFILTNQVDVPHCHVPIATWITSLARRHLYRSLAQCKRKFYCDTDSIITTDTLPTSDELGGLKLERVIDRGVFLAPKLYATEQENGGGSWEVKAKGFRKLTYEQFLSLQDGQEVEIARMARLREMFRAGVTSPFERVISKGLGARTAKGGRVQRLRDKRCMNRDGKDSRAWDLSEILAS